MLHKKLLKTLTHRLKKIRMPRRQMHTIDFIRHKMLITPQICFHTKDPKQSVGRLIIPRPTDLLDLPTTIKNSKSEPRAKRPTDS